MSFDEDDDDAQVSAQALGGLIRHVDGYKKYVKRLKKGHSSGVSNIFGRPADLLPDELVAADEAEIESEQKVYEVGESIFKEGLDPSLLRGLMDQLMTDINEKQDGEDAGSTSTIKSSQEIIAVLVENGKKKYLYSDLSIVDAEEHGQLSLNAEVSDEEELISQHLLNESESVLCEAKDKDLMEAFTSPLDFEESTADQVSLKDLVMDSEMIGNSSSYMHVTTASGDWLWDIVFAEEGVGQVMLADGSIIQKTVHAGQYVITRPGKSEETVPEIEVVGKVVASKSTGNLYYQSLRGDQAVALLNNGWRVDQYKQDDGRLGYFVTEPESSNELSSRCVRVKNLIMNPQTRDVCYETVDGSAVVTLKSGRIIN